MNIPIMSESLTAETDLTMVTAGIVAAYVGNNETPVDELPELITAVHAALSGLGAPVVETEQLPEPAVSVRASVKPDRVTCLDCGFSGKMLKRHLLQVHNLTPDQYRARWSLPADHALVAPNYAEVRRGLAKKIGLGRKPAGKA